MRQQITFVLTDGTVFRGFAITIQGKCLRINVKHLRDNSSLLSQTFESNIANLSDGEIDDRIKEVIVSTLKTTTSSFVKKIDGNINLDKESVNLILQEKEFSLRNAGVLRQDGDLPEISSKNPPAAEIVEVTQRAIDKPSFQVDFTELNRSIMQILDNSRNFNVTTSEEDPDAEDRFQVFSRLMGWFGTLSTEVEVTDREVSTKNVPVSHIFFRMSHDILDPEQKNLAEFKRQISSLISLMRQKKLEQAKEIAFVKMHTRSGLVPAYLFRATSSSTKNVTENESRTESDVDPDSLVTRAILQEGYDPENASFQLEENEVDAEYLDGNIFHLRKEFINLESSYQNLPEGDITKSDLAPQFVEMSRTSTDRISSALDSHREYRRALVQRRLLREVENILLEGGAGIGVGLKFVACAFKIMLDSNVIKYQCSECTNFTRGANSAESSATGCLKGYTDLGLPKKPESFCGDGETPAGGSSPIGIKYTMNDDISNKVLEEVNKCLTEA